MGVARWAVLWTALILLPCMPALAQTATDDEGGTTQGQYDQADGRQAVCPNAVEVVQVGPEKGRNVTPFSTTGRTFVVSYEVTFGDDDDDPGSVLIAVRDGSETVEDETVSEGEDDVEEVEEVSGSFVVTEDAGSYNLVVNAPQADTEYTVIVGDCRVSDDDNGDVDDPDDVVAGTGDDKPLPKTGGVPLLLGAASLALAAGLVVRRTLAR